MTMHSASAVATATLANLGSVLADDSALMFGPWPKAAYESAGNECAAAAEAAPASSRPPNKQRTPRMAAASACANAGSTNGYGSQAPFGSATSRFSPSMSMAHHVPNHKPMLANATTARGSKPNKRWVPPTLREEDVKEVKAPEKKATSATHGAQSSGSVSARKRSGGGGTMARPRSAGDEQRISRQLRAEITEMRDAKLRALREAQEAEEGGGGRRPTSAGRIVSPRTVVGLDGRILRHAMPAHALEHDDPGGSPMERGEEREISMEYASLLEFVAGESRRR